MVMFIKPCDGRVTSPFGYRIHPIEQIKKMHWGIDYGSTPSNNDIIASADGVVTRASIFDGYGNTIIITHKIDGVTYETLYAHLASMSVKVGASVKQGQKIGVKGTTGNSTGIHLHFELHKGGKRNSNYTYAVDPLLHISEQKEVKPVTPPVPVTKGVFRIKTGTFPNARTFANAVDKFKADFGVVTYETADATSFNPEYRIYTGTFTTKESAVVFQQKIKEKYGWVTYLIDETKTKGDVL